MTGFERVLLELWKSDYAILVIIQSLVQYLLPSSNHSFHNFIFVPYRYQDNGNAQSLTVTHQDYVRLVDYFD